MRNMTRPLRLLLLVALIAGAVLTIAWQRNAFAEFQKPNASNSPPADQKADALRELLKDDRIVAIQRWQVDEGERSLFCVFETVTSDPHYEGRGTKLSIRDSVGNSIYETYFGELERVYEVSALRTISNQLVLEVSYGGSTCFLRMLDYRAGKIVDLIDEKQSDFTVGASIRPQFRRGIVPALEPYQILLTNGVVLASSAKKYTTVFRYRDGEYRPVGQFAQQDLDDYLETRLMNLGRISKTQ